MKIAKISTVIILFSISFNSFSLELTEIQLRNFSNQLNNWWNCAENKQNFGGIEFGLTKAGQFVNINYKNDGLKLRPVMDDIRKTGPFPNLTSNFYQQKNQVSWTTTSKRPIPPNSFRESVTDHIFNIDPDSKKVTFTQKFLTSTTKNILTIDCVDILEGGKQLDVKKFNAYLKEREFYLKQITGNAR